MSSSHEHSPEFEQLDVGLFPSKFSTVLYRKMTEYLGGYTKFESTLLFEDSGQRRSEGSGDRTGGDAQDEVESRERTGKTWR